MIALPRMALSVACLGAAAMAALAFGLVLPPDYPFFGSQLYDWYARSLLSGTWEVPLRALRIEGHYRADGTGFLYHGLGPVITRLPFAPFVALPTTWIAPLSIWLWAVLGNIAWHASFATGLGRARIASEESRDLAHLLLAIAVWFAAPGLLLVANGTVYYEPVAMAYALSGGFMLVLLRLAEKRIAAGRALIYLALLAAAMLHARPHLAIGLYAATGVVALWLVLTKAPKAWRAGASAGAVLALSGVLLIASNAARFGEATQMHGSFEAQQVQYGTVFWGFEDPQGGRARAFSEHGRFNPGRVAPNALAYLASPPETGATGPALDALDRLHARMGGAFGEARIEQPRVGMVFLWPIWLALAALGLMQRDLRRLPVLAGLGGAGIGAVLLLAYPTITLRYHVDLWPLIALPSVFGIAPLVNALSSDLVWRMGTAALLALGIGVTGVTVGASRNLITEAPGSLSQAWSRDYCMERVAARQIAPSRAAELCSLGDAGERS